MHVFVIMANVGIRVDLIEHDIVMFWTANINLQSPAYCTA
jgi:hypothetical protein